MFLVRSAFWLTIAFIALRPHDVDLGKTATALSDQAMAVGQRMVAEQVLNNGCAIVRCQAAAPGSPAPHVPLQPAAASPAAPPVAIAMQASPAVRAAPVPRPRPAWLS